jgi:hypothetical protein
VLLMMEAAERGLGEWTAVLPGAEAALRRAASSEGTGTEPACSDVSLHAVLGEVRKSVCISRARACMPPSEYLLPACLLLAGVRAPCRQAGRAAAHWGEIAASFGCAAHGRAWATYYQRSASSLGLQVRCSLALCP